MVKRFTPQSDIATDLDAVQFPSVKKERVKRIDFEKRELGDMVVQLHVSSNLRRILLRNLLKEIRGNRTAFPRYFIT